MNDFKLNGTGNMTGGEYREIKIDGIVTCSGSIKAEKVTIDGIFECKGDLEADKFDCDGKAKTTGNIRAQQLKVDGMLKVKGGSKIEAEEIHVDGLLEVEGEISADKIDMDGAVKAQAMFGDSIKVHYNTNPISRIITKNVFEIGLMEATDIDLKGISAKEVNGKNIRIGKHCRIKKIDCNGTLFVDKSATVEEICGEHTFVD